MHYFKVFMKPPNSLFWDFLPGIIFIVRIHERNPPPYHRLSAHCCTQKERRCTETIQERMNDFWHFLLWIRFTSGSVLRYPATKCGCSEFFSVSSLWLVWLRPWWSTKPNSQSSTNTFGRRVRHGIIRGFGSILLLKNIATGIRTVFLEFQSQTVACRTNWGILKNSKLTRDKRPT